MLSAVAAASMPPLHLSLDSLTKDRFLFREPTLIAAKEATDNEDDNFLRKSGKRVKEELENVPKFVWGALVLTVVAMLCKDKFNDEQ